MRSRISPKPCHTAALALSCLTPLVAHSQTNCESTYLVSQLENAEDGFYSFVEAMDHGLNNCEAFTVTFDESLETQQIPINDRVFTIDDGQSVTIEGDSQHPKTFIGNAIETTLFNVNLGRLSLAHIDIDNELAPRLSAIIVNYDSSVELNNVSIENYQTALDSSGNTVIHNSTLSENGTALALSVGNASVVSINNSEISSNKYGVRAFIFGSTAGQIQITDSIFENNEQGALDFRNESSETVNLNIQNSVFRDNSVNGDGAAIEGSAGGNLTIVDSVFENNQALLTEASCYGGALNIEDMAVTINRSLFQNNWAGYGGGAAYFENISSLLIENTSFLGNQSPQGTGAIECVDCPDEVNITHSSFIENQGKASATDSGAVMVRGTGQSSLSISHSLFARNTGGFNNFSKNNANDFDLNIDLQYSFVDTRFSDIEPLEYTVSDMGGNILANSDELLDPQLEPITNEEGSTIGYQPQLTSPIYNTGEQQLEDAPETDRLGNPRVARGTIDIGAIERSNQAPVLVRNFPSIHTTAGEYTLNLTSYFSDPDEDNLGYSVENLPEGLQLDTSIDSITGTATTQGNYSILIRAEDPFEATATGVLHFEFFNEAPTISPPEAGLVISDPLLVNINLEPFLNDIEQNPIQVSIDNLPTGLVLVDKVISGSLGTVEQNETLELLLHLSDGYNNTEYTLILNIELPETPTPEPTPVPTNNPSPTPTPVPEPTPTDSPSPTSAPTADPTATPEPNSTSQPGPKNSSGGGGAIGKPFAMLLFILAILTTRRKKSGSVYES